MPILLSLLLMMAFVASPVPSGAGDLVLNTAHFPPRSTQAGDGFEDLLVKELFRRAGQQIQIVHLPSERCLVNVNDGLDAGNFARVAGLESKYTNLVMVPEPLAQFEFVVFSRRSDLPVTNWASARRYSVGIITGWKILEENLQGAKSLVKVKNHVDLFELLEAGRVDLVIFDRLEGKALIKDKMLQRISIYPEPLARRDMFLYLNSAHKPLVPSLTRHLKDMKRDGTYTATISNTLGTLK